MEWWAVILFIFGIFLLLMLAGLPVVFAFMFVNILGAYFFWLGELGLEMLVHRSLDSVAMFALLPVHTCG